MSSIVFSLNIYMLFSIGKHNIPTVNIYFPKVKSNLFFNSCVDNGLVFRLNGNEFTVEQYSASEILKLLLQKLFGLFTLS